MQTELRTVSPDATIREVVQQLADTHGTELPVCVITQSDMVRGLAQGAIPAGA